MAQTLKYISLALIALLVAFLLFMGIGEMVSGDFSGVMHIITAVPFCIFGYLIIKKLRKPTSK